MRKASSWSRKLRLSCAGEGTAAVDRANLEGQTILVMEGEVLIALDLRLVLEQAGAQVHVVRNAAEAFVTEGSGVVIVNGHKTRLKAGTIV